MSTNITRWKVKKLQRFSITDLEAFIGVFERGRKRGWNMDSVTDQVIILPVEDGVIGGTKQGDGFIITDIHLVGEGSGTCWYEFLKPAMAFTSGILIVKTIWEGEGIVKITVKDGVVTEEEIEL